VRIVRASQVPHAGDRTGRLVQLVRGVGGTEHLTSTYGSDHQHVEWEQFHRAGIAVRSQEFAHPVYPQIGRGFVPDLAAVDMLFSLGRRSGGVLAERRRSVRVVPTAAGHG